MQTSIQKQDSWTRWKADSSMADCLGRMAAGEAEAFEEIYRGTRGAVYGFALSLLKNAHDAEDVAQEVYLRLCADPKRYREEGKPMAYLLRLTRNLCYDRLRAHQLRGTEPLLEQAAPWADPALSQEDRLVIRSCLEGLREEEQRAVLLHVLGGFRFREIAAFEGEPLSTVLSRYHRAMKKLRKVLS